MAITRHIDDFLAEMGVLSPTNRSLGGRRGQAFIYDIDDTLTHGSNPELYPEASSRIWMSDPGEGSLAEVQDWRKWNQARANAEPNLATIAMLRQIQGEGYGLVGFTARTREAHGITRQWLNEQGIEAPIVTRRMAWGNEPPVASKERMLTALQRRVPVIGGMEDSSSNIEMFRRLGAPHIKIAGGLITDIPSELPEPIRRIAQTQRDLPQIAMFSGYGGSGKDTAADYLADTYGYRRLAFSDPIAERMLQANPRFAAGSAQEMVRGLHPGTAEGRQAWAQAKQDPDFAAWMIRAGNEMREQDPDVFTRLARERIDANPGSRWVVTGPRTEAELGLVDRYPGSATIRVDRPGVGPRNNDPNEIALARRPFHHRIENAGTIQDLHRGVEQLVRQRTSTRITPERLASLAGGQRPLSRHAGRVIARAPEQITSPLDAVIDAGTSRRDVLTRAAEYQERMARLYQADVLGAGVVRGVEGGRVAFHDPMMRLLGPPGRQMQDVVRQWDEGLPPVAPGHERLYRGEHVRSPALGSLPGQENLFGRWYSENLYSGLGYATRAKGGYNNPALSEAMEGFGHIRYTDVPATARPSGPFGNQERVVSPEAAQASRPLTPGLVDEPATARATTDPMRTRVMGNLRTNRLASAAHLRAEARTLSGSTPERMAMWNKASDAKRKRAEKLTQRRQSTARRQLMSQESVPGYIDDPRRTNPFM